MDILKSKSEVKERLSKEKIGAIHLLRLQGYGSIRYRCACGQEHDLNGDDVKRLASAKSFKVLLKCQNEYYTMISCLLYTSPSPRDMRRSRMPSSA